MEPIQSIHEAVDVTDWLRDEEFAEYPEGAREKAIVYSPFPPLYPFLIGGHRYLFKLSSRRYPEQYWMEIIAYDLGVEMGVAVPPAFVAYDSKRNQSGALIEWFLARNLGERETYMPGGDFCQIYIPNFERKKGEQHNFQTIAQILNGLANSRPFRGSWKECWAKTLTFDALIGNTDRHQDNWGVILNVVSDEMYMSPVFDNGTSMGHEITEEKLVTYDDAAFDRYISRGAHHMKWDLSDPTRMRHVDMLKKLAIEFPEARQIMVDCLKRVSGETFARILNKLAAFDVPVRLSAERANFMLKLLQYRHQRLLSELEN